MRWPAALAALILIGCSGAAGYWRSQHYADLGLQPGAAADDVRKAYRQLALQLHPDKNPSQAATDRWLRVQQAYEVLTDKGSGSSSINGSGAGSGPSVYHQHSHDASSRFWRGQQQQERAPPHIPSDTEDLDASTFHRRVLSTDSRASGAGGAWLLQIYTDASPYCRVLNVHWEVAAREMMGAALTFARIDAAAHPMLVRFVSSHLRLFRTPQPSSLDLPAVFGLPSGCTRMDCAVVYTGRFTAQRLQHFAATQLLQLVPLPPLSRHLLGAWRRHAQAAGRVALLVLLPEGQQQPAALTSAVARAQGPADQSAWAAAVGVVAAPALVFWHSQGQQPPLVVLGDSISYAAEIEQHSWQAVPPLQVATAHYLPACQPGARISGGEAGAGAAPPEELCVLLLGRGGEQALAEGRKALEVLHQQLSSSGSTWSVSAEVRQAARSLAGGKLQLAWADATQQAALCRHLLRWSQSSASSSCLCGPWWQRLLVAALGRCSLRQAPPALVAYRWQQQQQQAGGRFRSGRSSPGPQLLVAAFSGSLSETQPMAAWLAAAASAVTTTPPKRQQQREQQVLHPAPPFAGQLTDDGPARGTAALLLRVMHQVSQVEVLWQQAAMAVRGAAGVISWRQMLLVGAVASSMVGLKRLLDVLSGEDGDDVDGSNSPCKAPMASHGSSGDRRASTGGFQEGSKVREMRHSDWEPRAGQFLVVLPLPAGKGSFTDGSGVQQQGAAAAAAAEQRLASLAAAFQRERRLAFRLAPVSDALARLLNASRSGNSSAANATSEPQLEQQAVALVLHPRRRRFQVVPLVDVQAAVLRLEAVLDGSGEWCAA